MTRAAAVLSAPLVLLLACAACQREEAPRSGPRLVADAPRADLGVAAPGARLEHAFVVRNDGGRDLRLASLRTSCECSAAAVPGATLAPGESGRIELACALAPVAGRQRRTVTVYSNDAAQPVLTLALEVDVAADIAAQTPQFYFGRARRGERTARDIRLRLADPGAVPRAARSRDGRFETRLERRGDDEWRVALTVAPQAPRGVVEDVIVVETASARQPQLTIPVLGRVDGEGE